MQTLNVVQLREMKTVEALPFRVRFSEANDNLVIDCLQVLRFLPGRRLVCKGQWGERTILLKLFLHRRKAKRDYLKEQHGHQAMYRSGVRTPAQVLAGQLPLAGYYIAYDFIEQSTTYSRAYEKLNTAQRLTLNRACVGMLARLHNRGFEQSDIHLDNILFTDKELSHPYLLDAGEVKPLPRFGKKRAALNNLAKFIAQLPSADESSLPEYLGEYRSVRSVDESALKQAVAHWRNWRIRKYLAKSARNSSEFNAQKIWSEFRVVRKPLSFPELTDLLDNPNKAMAMGEVLKDGNTATVVKVQLNDTSVVIKRYNIKNWRHALSRFWRSSRAWHSWQNALMLETIGIQTPAPIAVMEKRIGPFRKEAYLLMQAEESPDILQHLSETNQQASPQLQNTVRSMLEGLCRCRISHGDMKGTNLLVTARGISLIDLDAMQQHTGAWRFKRAFSRDLMRFMRNWQASPTLRAQFSKLLQGLAKDSVCDLSPDRIKQITDDRSVN